ncbi:hypothetical protein EJ08DRAFT_702810 [Tothia fuscella]|uniref:Uncharacterized protein n=1 Tax=Tothia fuscella TaxID=1048955 RepID=A0A9P4TT53_9PEZI|nr:hypothetical protein EJ08DRAFT_702810 [Tothia fuscella]
MKAEHREQSIRSQRLQRVYQSGKSQDSAKSKSEPTGATPRKTSATVTRKKSATSTGPASRKNSQEEQGIPEVEEEPVTSTLSTTRKKSSTTSASGNRKREIDFPPAEDAPASKKTRTSSNDEQASNPEAETQWAKELRAFIALKHNEQYNHISTLLVSNKNFYTTPPAAWLTKLRTESHDHVQKLVDPLANSVFKLEKWAEKVQESVEKGNDNVETWTRSVKREMDMGKGKDNEALLGLQTLVKNLERENGRRFDRLRSTLEGLSGAGGGFVSAAPGAPTTTGGSAVAIPEPPHPSANSLARLIPKDPCVVYNEFKEYWQMKRALERVEPAAPNKGKAPVKEPVKTSLVRQIVQDEIAIDVVRSIKPYYQTIGEDLRHLDIALVNSAIAIVTEAVMAGGSEESLGFVTQNVLRICRDKPTEGFTVARPGEKLIFAHAVTEKDLLQGGSRKRGLDAKKTTTAHTWLVVLENLVGSNGVTKYPRMTFYDSHKDFLDAKKRQLEVVELQKVITNMNWLGKKDSKFSTVPKDATVAQQKFRHGEYGGLFTVFNGWAVALGLTPNKGFQPNLSFYKEAQAVLNLAFSGYIDSAAIYAFLLCYKYVTVAAGDNSGTAPASAFKNTISIRGAGDLVVRHKAALDGGDLDDIDSKEKLQKQKAVKNDEAVPSHILSGKPKEIREYLESKLYYVADMEDEALVKFLEYIAGRFETNPKGAEEGDADAPEPVETIEEPPQALIVKLQLPTPAAKNPPDEKSSTTTASTKPGHTSTSNSSPCPHSEQQNGLCLECGQDMTQVEKVAMKDSDENWRAVAGYESDADGVTTRNKNSGVEIVEGLKEVGQDMNKVVEKVSAMVSNVAHDELNEGGGAGGEYDDLFEEEET